MIKIFYWYEICKPMAVSFQCMIKSTTIKIIIIIIIKDCMREIKT